MKPIFVSVVLVLLAACHDLTEPPPPRVPIPVPDEGRPVVITGRVMRVSPSIAVYGANIRVIETGASVGTDETGRFQIVLPAQFRGSEIPVQVRAIGFKPQSARVRLSSDTVRVDFPMDVSMLQGCVLDVVVVGVPNRR